VQKNLFVKLILLSTLIAMLLGLQYLNAMAKIGVGYMTKVMCSEIYLANRNYDNVIQEDFNNIDPLITKISLKHNKQEKSISGTLFGLGRNKSIYRDKLGCTVDPGKGISKVTRSNSVNYLEHVYPVEMNTGIQNDLKILFEDKKLPHPIGTRGALVIQNGKIIAEQYASGFNKNTRQQSWSMAKGVTQALIGIGVKKKYFSLESNKLLPNWNNDTRAKITLGHLLQMASGLKFSEDYSDPFSNVDQMLFNQADMGEYAASLPLQHEPGTNSIYASGTTNIVSKILQNTLIEENVSYIDFPYIELFAKLGMQSAIFEIDASGSFIGSSYIYATVRDFARFGQLYLQNGVWNNEQILPSHWVNYTRQTAPNSQGKYGSHWSINFNQNNFPGMSKNVIALGGNDGQYIFVIPEKNAVIVRLGIMRKPATLEKDLYPLIKSIYDKL